MKYIFFIEIFATVFICFCSCQKEPKKGEYRGTFTGRYETDVSSGTYTTDYYFDITHSTKKELRIMEKQSKITSILKKHENDSISGKIGFGGIYNPEGNASVRFNFITIAGKYDKKSITGSFSTTFGDGNQEYLSEGDLTISAY
jgi:hypothetical protein